MDRQTLRDWVHRFNGLGPEGLIDSWTEGPKPRLSAEQMADLLRRTCTIAHPDKPRTSRRNPLGYRAAAHDWVHRDSTALWLSSRRW